MFDLPFIPGLKLSELLYTEAVRPILEQHFPRLVYSAARLGAGSDVLGFDTARSTDHGWGPMLTLFVSEKDYVEFSTLISSMLAEQLPFELHGYPTNFAHEGETTWLELTTSRPIAHGV